jgi:hypothetical protein
MGLVAVVLTVVACADEPCPPILFTAVRVHVTSSAGLEPDSVTASQGIKSECHRLPPEGDVAGVDATFACHEMRDELYVIQVTSGSLTWTQSTTVASDGCHVAEAKELEFELDPATAD